MSFPPPHTMKPRSHPLMTDIPPNTYIYIVMKTVPVFLPGCRGHLSLGEEFHLNPTFPGTQTVGSCIRTIGGHFPNIRHRIIVRAQKRKSPFGQPTIE